MEGIRSIHSIVARLPLREFDIRRRCICDPGFRSICSDYEEAAVALRYWKQRSSKEGDQKVAEYTNFLGELEAEILAQLDQPI
jgi:hypothetical protein